jgi:hypothetical protein
MTGHARAARLLRAVAAAGAALILLAACEMGDRAERIYIHGREWYQSQEIEVPFGVDGGARYAEYTYEYDAGAGWVPDTTRMIRTTGRGDGLIRFTAADPSWEHRLTVSLLLPSSPGGPLEPVDTIVRRFRIDNTVPSAQAGSLNISVLEGGVLATPPYTGLNASQIIEVVVDHVEFAAPSGSRTAVFWAFGGNVPNEFYEGTDNPRTFEIWPGFGGSYTDTLTFIVMDEAGNRSGLRVIPFEIF